jgi:hypothetical protein
MRIFFFAVPALLLAGCSAQGDVRPGPSEPSSKAPAVTYSSAFEGYRPFAEEELRDWRKANEEVGAAGGDRPGKPESAGGHGGHK